MGLKIELKPGERVMLGGCVVTNSDQRTRLLVEGNVPILREKDIMTPSRADTPAKRIYLAVQLMYLSRDPCAHHETYFALMRDILEAAPSTWRYIESINNHILTGELYKALKDAKKLISYEGELLDDELGAVRESGALGSRFFVTGQSGRGEEATGGLPTRAAAEKRELHRTSPNGRVWWRKLRNKFPPF